VTGGTPRSGKLIRRRHAVARFEDSDNGRAPAPPHRATLTITGTAVRSLRPIIRSVPTEGVPLAWLMADQAVIALTNFVTNILFARWLPPVDYGILAVSFTGYLLLTVIHYGGILEPLLV
jgi:hypothetical protein